MKKKKKKKKGFTLIELLAVILILGIIALIAIPTVNGVIQESRKGAAKTTIENYVKAVEQQIIVNKLDSDSSNDIVDGKYTVDDLKGKGLSMKGKMPDSGYILVVNEEVFYLYLNTDNFTIFKNDKDEYIVENHIENLSETTDCFDFQIDSFTARESKYLPIKASVEQGKTYHFKGHAKFELEEKNTAMTATDFIVQSPLMPGVYALFKRYYNLGKNIEFDFEATHVASKTLTDTSAILVDTTGLKGKISITNFTVEEVK